MCDALAEHDRIVSKGGRNITNLRFADDIDALAKKEQEQEALVERLDKTCTSYKMEISVGRTKVTTNSAYGIQMKVNVKGQKLGSSTSEQLFQMMAQNQRFSRELHKSLRLLQSQFGDITTYRLDQR